MLVQVLERQVRGVSQMQGTKYLRGCTREGRRRGWVEGWGRRRIGSAAGTTYEYGFHELFLRRFFFVLDRGEPPPFELILQIALEELTVFNWLKPIKKSPLLPSLSKAMGGVARWALCLVALCASGADARDARRAEQGALVGQKARLAVIAQAMNCSAGDLDDVSEKLAAKLNDMSGQVSQKKLTFRVKFGLTHPNSICSYVVSCWRGRGEGVLMVQEVVSTAQIGTT